MTGLQIETIAERTLIGLMSGTSVDSIDACCVTLSMDGGRLQHRILGTYTHPIPDGVRSRLLAVMAGEPVFLKELCALNFTVGELFAEAVEGLFRETGVARDKVDAIGSHGQTVYHLPPERGEGAMVQTPGSTLQIGEPSIIAQRTGITTIADFRPRDMAAGGQGAPLVCFADALLFQSPEMGRCVQNIGGIANVTVLPTGGMDQMMAFDTGPGNMLIDGVMVRFFQKPYDEGGQVAASGQIHSPLLERLMAHPFLSESPPKTTGREAFGQAYLETLLAEFPHLEPRDWVSTLTLYTAKTIADAYEAFVLPRVSVREVIVGGGGIYNVTLMETLRQLLNTDGRQIALKTHEDYGVPSKYKEALAFAMLAWARLENLPNNVPVCTGAKGPVSMGKILPGR